MALAHPQSGSLSTILAQIYPAQLAGLTWERCVVLVAMAE